MFFHYRTMMDDKGVNMPVIKAFSALGFTSAAVELASKWGIILSCTYSALLILQLLCSWVMRAIAAYRVRAEKKQKEKAAAIEMAKESEFSFLNVKVEQKEKQ